MFTGIIHDRGTILLCARGDRGALLRVETPSIGDWVIGESVSVNGCCLTVTCTWGCAFDADLSDETLRLTTFKEVRVGEDVNLERALRLSDRMGGHIVTGHVDAVGEIRSVTPGPASIEMAISLPVPLLKYVVNKGSIAIDGVSLTVSLAEGDKTDGLCRVHLIPHTCAETTLTSKKPGDKVNIEVDCLAKWVESLLGIAHGQ